MTTVEIVNGSVNTERSTLTPFDSRALASVTLADGAQMRPLNFFNKTALFLV